MDHNKNNNHASLQPYSAKEWAMFALFPIIKTAGVLPTQPLVKIAIEQQKSTAKSTGPLNFIQAIQRIHAVRGTKGFVDGSGASMSREAFKTSYKGVLQVAGNDLKGYVPEGIYGEYFLKGAIAGSFVGVIDSTIAAPVERYKTFKIGQDVNANLRGFLKAIKQQTQTNTSPKMSFVQEVYRGLAVTIAKQTLMNVAFFTTKSWVDVAVKPYQNDYPVMSLAVASITAGTGAAIVGAPLDVAKTLKQQQTGKNIPTKQLLALVLAQSGWKGLVAGVPARFLLINFGYGLNGLFLNVFSKIRPTKIEDKIENLSDQLGKLSISPSSTEQEPPVKPLLFTNQKPASGNGFASPPQTNNTEPTYNKKPKL